jgi:hypothetical protein
VIVIAVIYANTVYMALLALAGPENRLKVELRQLDSDVDNIETVGDRKLSARLQPGCNTP